MRYLMAALCLLLFAGSARADIPYRYPVLEGFILAVDDSSSRAVPRSDPLARAVLDAFAAVLESDRFRIPVEYGRTLAWNVGTAPPDGITREAQLDLFNESRSQDASRAQPANVLFLRLSERDGAIRVRADWVDAVRGESETRYASDAVASVEELAAFFEAVGEDMLIRLGPAPARGYGEVPPPWLIEPFTYRVEFRDLPRDIRDEVLDVMIYEFPHFVTQRILDDEPDRLTVAYETRAPSWWLAERLAVLFEDLNYAARIEPRQAGLRIEPAG